MAARYSLLAALAVVLAGVLGYAPGCSQPAPTIEELVPGRPVDRRLAAGQPHAYELAVEAGHYLELTLDQRGVDVFVTLFDPAGVRLFQVDSPNADQGPERVLTVAESAGRHRLEVEAWQGEGPYRILVEALRPATAIDRTRAAAAHIFRQGEDLRRQKRSEEAIAAYREALAGWQAVDDRAWQAETYDRLGRVHAALGEWRRVLDFHHQAWSLYRGDLRQQATTQDQIGQAYWYLGETDHALACFERALSLWQEAGERTWEALSWNHLGLTYGRLGELQRALDAYDRALERWREFGDREKEAGTLHNLGRLYAYLGRDQRALDHCQAADALWAQLDNPRDHAKTLSLIGRLYRQRGEPDRALAELERALDLRRAAGDRRGLGYTLIDLALVHRDRSQPDRALRLFQQAQALFVELEGPYGEAQTRRYVAAIHADADQLREAEKEYRQAVALYREIRHPRGEADALAGLAAVEHRRGELAAARDELERALGIYEALRQSALGQDLRASYFATVEDQYGAYVDLLMELDRHQPGAGYGVRALEASEQARARSLLEMIRQASTAPRRDADPELLDRERAVQDQLNALERLRLRHFDDRPARGPQNAALERKLRALAEELHEVRSRILRSRPQPAALDAGEPLGVAEIRRQVLDEETLLVEIELGRERSFLWLLGAAHQRSFELPPREAVERMARTAHHFLRRSHRPEGAARSQRALCELSCTLLGPAAEELAGQRLLIVPDGALHYVPFAALPDPDAECSAAPPLVAGHEIVQLPSASILAALRRQRGRREPPPGTLAVVADPVFESGTAPLPFSRREAEAILAAVPAGETLPALGFEASKARATSGELAGYRIVHFATHGVLNTEQPELTSLLLAQVDARGQPLDGRLYAHEIYNLELAADLVVLSACETALGQEIRGEGLIGLTQGFFHAGAVGVIASLWNVNDRVTAELMEGFYRALVGEGLRPAAALRRAQLALWRQERSRAPYYWAGFVLQGDG